MALLEWSSNFCIGIAALDDEHRKLCAAVNELHAALEGGKERGVTGPLLRRLADDTRAHFSSEEAMMTASNYPGLLLHAMKHQYLLAQMQAFQARYIRDDSSMNSHSLVFLRDWVATHIQSDDLNFGLWLNEHGKR